MLFAQAVGKDPLQDILRKIEVADLTKAVRAVSITAADPFDVEFY